MDDNANFIGSMPQHYDHGLVPIIFADYAADIAKRVAAARPSAVLETAAGTGIVTRLLRDLLPATTQLTVTDLNAPMLEIARQKFEAGEQVVFQAADATALPFGDRCFDAVVCQFGVMFFPDKDKGYREVHRVLVPGGRYIFNVWDSHRYNLFGRITHQTISSFFAADPPQFFSVPFSYYQIDPIKESLLAAGFVDFAVEVLSREKVVPEVLSFVRGLIYGNPLIDQVRARGGVDPEAIVEAVVREMHREFGADPGRMPLQAMVVSARKPS